MPSALQADSEIVNVSNPHTLRRLELPTTRVRVVRPCVLLLLLGGSLICAGQALAERPSPIPMPFDLIKGLVGTWQESTREFEGQESIVVEYSLTAKGTAVVERLFPDTPKEMVSVYTQDGHETVMTHYCMLGNQPRMRTRSPVNENSITLSYIDGTGMRSPDDRHMNELTLTFVDDRHMTHEWTVLENGREKVSHTFAFTRQ